MSIKEFILSPESASYFTELSRRGIIDSQTCVEISNCTNVSKFKELIKSIYDLNAINVGKLWVAIIHKYCFNDVRVKDYNNLSKYQIRFIKKLIELGGAVLKKEAFGNVLYNNSLLEKNSLILEELFSEENFNFNGFVKYIRLSKGWQVMYLIDVDFYKEVISNELEKN